MRYRTTCPGPTWEDAGAKADLLGLLDLLDRQVTGVDEYPHLGEVHIRSVER